MSRSFMLGISMLLVVGIGVAIAQTPVNTTQANQERLIEQLRSGNTALRSAVLHDVQAMPSESVGPALREQLIEELERTNDLKRQSRSSGVSLDTLEAPEYIYELHRVVAALKDPDSIPALANALGNFTVVGQLADMGEQAAPAVLDVVTNPASHHYVVDDGLRVLRMMVETQTTQPLSAATVSRIRDAAEQRLTGTQYFTTVWYAIDLAAVLDDPELEQKLELISNYSTEVIAFGIDDPQLIEQTQQRAAERLAGVSAQPQRADIPVPGR